MSPGIVKSVNCKKRRYNIHFIAFSCNVKNLDLLPLAVNFNSLYKHGYEYDKPMEGVLAPLNS